MYNRYINNTGQYYHPVGEQHPPHQTAAPPPNPTASPQGTYHPHAPPAETAGAKSSIGKLFDFPAGIRDGIQGILPDWFDVGDILLILTLLYLYLEDGDDDMLIVLIVLTISWILPLFRRGDNADQTKSG